MRSARINLLLWSICTLVAAANVAMNLLLRTDLMYFWLAVNAVTVMFDVTCLKYAVHGYFWRKEQDAARARDEEEMAKFMTVITDGYQKP